MIQRIPDSPLLYLFIVVKHISNLVNDVHKVISIILFQQVSGPWIKEIGYDSEGNRE